jgi:hypothetical protein
LKLWESDVSRPSAERLRGIRDWLEIDSDTMLDLVASAPDTMGTTRTSPTRAA